ncbi:hypothetical protein ENBRE01_2331 [Enteropsectra breve]|nr:hypothetical protein ENBRE01_2331 [Enteropsectra breve]
MNTDDLNRLEHLILLDSSSEEEEKMVYSNQWLQNIEMMSAVQFSETFRMSRECFSRLEQKIRRSGGVIADLKTKLLVFIFYISHISTYRKLREIFGFSHAKIYRIIG